MTTPLSPNSPRSLPGEAPHSIRPEGDPEGYPLEPDARCPDAEPERGPRPEHRQFFALIAIAAATAIMLGGALRMPAQVVANDISRWCTVCSLVGPGPYAIHYCPFTLHTQHKPT